MLRLTGEIRGVRTTSYQQGDKSYLIMEDGNLNTYKIGLSEDHIKSGFVSQINTMKGKTATISLSCGTYQNSLFYRYEGKELPVEIKQPVKAAS